MSGGHKFGDTNLIRVVTGRPLFINATAHGSMVLDLRHRPRQRVSQAESRGDRFEREGHWSNAETSVSALTK